MLRRLKLPILLLICIIPVLTACKEPLYYFYIRNFENRPLTVKFYIEGAQFRASDRVLFLFAGGIMEEKKFYAAKKDSVYLNPINKGTISITIPGRGMLYLNTLPDILMTSGTKSELSIWEGEKMVDHITGFRQLFRAFRNRPFFSGTYIYDYFRGSVKIIPDK